MEGSRDALETLLKILPNPLKCLTKTYHALTRKMRYQNGKCDHLTIGPRSNEGGQKDLKNVPIKLTDRLTKSYINDDIPRKMT